MNEKPINPENSPTSMLEFYRHNSPPLIGEQVEMFKKMSLAERDELLFYGLLWAFNQYADIIRRLTRLEHWIMDPPSSKPN